GVEGRGTNWIFVRVKMAVGASRRRGIIPAIALDGGGNRIGGTFQRGHRKVARMGIANGFTRDRSQPKTLVLIERAGFETAIIENESLRFAIFHEKFAVIAAFQALRDKALDIIAAGVETVDQAFHKNKSCSMCLLQDVSLKSVEN